MAMHRVALAMHRPVRELDLTLDELVDWLAFERIHPFIDERIEFMLAQLTQIYVSAHSKRRYKLSDFMLSHILEKEGDTGASDAQIISVFKGLKDGEG